MATYNTAFGSLPGTKEMLGTDNTTGGGQQQAYGANAVKKRKTPQGTPQQGGQTFAQLQQQGFARPAPPTGEGVNVGGGAVALPAQRSADGEGFQAQLQNQLQNQNQPQQAPPPAPQQGAQPPRTKSLMDQLQEQLLQLQMGASAEQQKALDQKQKATVAELEAKFGAERSSLKEELARRGLSDSSIGGGRYGDLAGQQARALSSLQAELLSQQAVVSADRQKTLISGLQGAVTAQADIDYRAAQLQQEERLKGRELTLQEARDMATKEYQSKQLDVSREEIGSRERISSSELASAERRQLAQMGFDEKMEGKRQELQIKLQANQISSEERRQLQDLDSRKSIAQMQIDAEKLRQESGFSFQRGESGLQRAFTAEQEQKRQELDIKLQEGRITADEVRQLRELDARKEESAAQRTFTAAQDQLRMNLEEKLQQGRITADERRQLTELTARKEESATQRQFTAEQETLRRSLEKELQEGRITADGQRQLAELTARKDEAALNRTFQREEGLTQRTFTAEQDQKRMDLEEKLQEGRITADEERQLRDLQARKDEAELNRTFQSGESKLERDLREKLTTAGTQVERDRMLLDILKSVGGDMTDEQRAQFLARYGLKPPTGTPPGGPTGPAGPGNPQGSSPRVGDRRTTPNGEEETFDGIGWRKTSGGFQEG